MFTGIVQNLGTLKAKEPVKAGVRLKIQTALSAKNLKKGTSISVDGVCLTVEEYNPKTQIFQVTCVPETLKISKIESYKVGEKVNLEPSLLLSDSLAGHFVLGHVDFKSEVLENPPQLRLAIPSEFIKFSPKKGSVTVNGVSLTIAGRDEKSITIALIPETLKKTNLGILQLGDKVNIEIDVLARYIESLNQSV